MSSLNSVYAMQKNSGETPINTPIDTLVLSANANTYNELDENL